MRVDIRTATVVPLEGVPGVFTDRHRLFTVNAAPGRSVYGEWLVVQEGVEYRAWDPNRSKLAAMIIAGARGFGISPGSNVLYLGAASGTTASHVSDIVSGGVVTCVEFSQRSFRDLVGVCESRPNMIPIMADASLPEGYAGLVESVDVVYQDIAQRDQAEIFARNMEAFEAERGILMVKSRSVSVASEPSQVFDKVARALTSSGMRVTGVVDIGRFAGDHAALMVEGR
jgi:fibrillarin-like pre-rRNA processing protein